MAVDFSFDNYGPSAFLRGKKVLSGRRDGKMYILDLKVVPPVSKALTAATLDEWHSRLAHMPKDLIVEMEKSKSVESLKVISEPKT